MKRPRLDLTNAPAELLERTASRCFRIPEKAMSQGFPYSITQEGWDQIRRARHALTQERKFKPRGRNE